MKTGEILSLFDEQERRQGVAPMYRREAADGVVRHVSHRPDRLSFVVYSELTAVTANHAIQSQIDYFRQFGRPRFEWKVYEHDQPPDLKTRLAAHGFQPDEPETLLVIDVADLPTTFQPAGEADVRRLTDVAQIEDVVGVITAVWNHDFTWLKIQLTDYLTNHPDFISLYAAYVDGQPVSTAWSYFSQGSQFVSLWGGATLAEYRGRGLYSALITARAEEARRRGGRFLWVNAGDESRPILLRRGFRLLTTIYPYVIEIKPLL